MNSLDLSLKNIEKISRRICHQLRPGDILTLSGPLAAGKTTLTQQILRNMDYKENVTSPTFVIEHRYPVDYHKIKEVIHLDLYRLNESDLKHLDWSEYVDSKNSITIIEWPEIAKNYLPKNTKQVTIDILAKDARRLTFSENFDN